MKLWAGRFQKQTDELVNDFNASISFDQRLYKQDITGSMAHAQMLCDCGILTAQDNEKIQQGLTELLAEIEAGKVTFTADNEDIHMNVETLLTAKIGDAGKRLHTARSRNDQVALDFRLYLREEISGVIEKLLQLEKVLCEKAKAHTQTVMPGYTHLQRAQPITFAQHLLAIQIGVVLVAAGGGFIAKLESFLKRCQRVQSAMGHQCLGGQMSRRYHASVKSFHIIGPPL